MASTAHKIIIPTQDVINPTDYEDVSKKTGKIMLFVTSAILVASGTLIIIYPESTILNAGSGIILIIIGIILAAVAAIVFPKMRVEMEATIKRMEGSSSANVQQQFFQNFQKELLKEEAKKMLMMQTPIHIASINSDVQVNYAYKNQDVEMTFSQHIIL